MAKIGRVQEVSIDLLKPYRNNAKIHGEDQIKRIAESIQEFGFISPCLIDKDYNIIAGHGRVMSAKLLGMTEVPCLFIEGLTEAQRKAYILADNRLTELGEWDFDKIQLELEELADLDFDISLTGFELNEEDETDVIEDDFAEENIEPKAKLGDLYILGNSRLICGDSADTAVIDRLMDGVKAKLLLTDPPYGIDVVKGNKVGGDKAFGKVGGGNIVKSKTYSAIIGDDTTDTARANYDVALTCTENQIIFGGNYFIILQIFCRRQGVGLFGTNRTRETLRMLNLRGLLSTRA